MAHAQTGLIQSGNGRAANGTSGITIRADGGVALAASPNPAGAEQPVTLTAILTTPGSMGIVSFLSGTTKLGLATVVYGRAILSSVKLSPGSYSLTAHYSGDTNSPPATSEAINLVVNH